MAQTVTCEVWVWVLVDENGDHAATANADNLADVYDSEVGGGSELAKRKVHVVLTVPVPEPAELRGTVPAEGAAELVSAA